MNGSAAGGRLLIVDDDDVTRRLLIPLLTANGYSVEEAGSGEAGLELLFSSDFDLVLLDLHMPGRDGIEVLTEAHARGTRAEFILFTAHGSVETAVRAMRHGAFDFLLKPLRTDVLLRTIERALAETASRRALEQRVRAAAQDVRQGLIGTSPAMQVLWDQIEKVAPTRATVLITGETGTGKELVAQAIHALSPRAEHPFIPANCASLPESLLQSELFGHVKGSFTGAATNRQGLFEAADGGTLLLDEISTISPAIQVALLRVIQEREIVRVGSVRRVRVDLRLLAATNVDLAADVERGAFREDLYYRLNVFPLRVPTLRERRDDIPALARHFVALAAEENGLPPPELGPRAIDTLMACDWPGNVRQLANVIESAVIAQPGGVIHSLPMPELKRPRHHDNEAHAAPARMSLQDMERERIHQALVETRWHRTRAADLLGIDRRTLYRKLKRYELPLGDA